MLLLLTRQPPFSLLSFPFFVFWWRITPAKEAQPKNESSYSSTTAQRSKEIVEHELHQLCWRPCVVVTLPHIHLEIRECSLNPERKGREQLDSV